MKKIREFLRKGIPAIILSVVLTSVGCYFSLPSRGLATCFPLIALSTAAAGFLVDKYIWLPPLVFLTTYLFTFSVDKPERWGSSPIGFSVFVPLYAAVVSLLACVFVFFAKKAIKAGKKNWWYIPLSVVFAAVLIFSNTPINGTPWGYMKAGKEIENVIDNNFVADEIEAGNLYFCPFDGTYARDTALVYRSGEKAQLVYKNGVVNENVTGCIVSTLSEETVNKLTALLRGSFATDNFNIYATEVGSGIGKITAEIGEEAAPYIGYTVVIGSEETAKSFVNKVQRYISVLDAGGIKTGPVTFAGGAKQKLYYKIKVDIGGAHSSVASLLSPFDPSLPFDTPGQ